MTNATKKYKCSLSWRKPVQDPDAVARLLIFGDKRRNAILFSRILHKGARL